MASGPEFFFMPDENDEQPRRKPAETEAILDGSTLQASDPSNSDQLVWTPDGRTLAVHCDHDNKLQMWQAAFEAGDSSK